MLRRWNKARQDGCALRGARLRGKRQARAAIALAALPGDPPRPATSNGTCSCVTSRRGCRLPTDARRFGERRWMKPMRAFRGCAIRSTKYALNNWLRAAGPIFDASLGMEFLGFGGREAPDGAAPLR